MNKFKLQRATGMDTAHIVAPAWCPYKEGSEHVEDEQVVHVGMCGLCRQCEFIPITALPESSLSPNERSLFVNYLTQVNIRAATTLSAQQAFLGKSDKLPIAILLSPTLFEELLHHVYADNPFRLQKVMSHFSNTEEPLCHLMGMPVYMSRKLTKSYLQVVGEVAWK